MGYADAIRAGTANFNTVATLIENAGVDGLSTSYTTVQSIASSTLADVTGISISATVKTGDSVFLIARYSFSGGTVGDYLNMVWREDSTDLDVQTSEYISFSNTDGNRQNGVIPCLRLSPTAGSRTYKLRWARFGGGTAYLKNIYAMAFVFQNR